MAAVCFCISDTGTSMRCWSLDKMNFKIVVFLALVSLAYSQVNESAREGRFINYKKKNYDDAYKKSDLEETKRSEEYAGEALDGMYLDCLAQVSFSCVQKKVLNFINRMNRMEKFSVLGNYVSVVRTKNEFEPESQFQARLDSAEQQSGLDDVMETTIDRFLNSHIFRVKVPKSFSVIKPSESRSYEETTSLDFRFPYADAVEGRKKGGGGGGGKMGKKMMMMMMMGLKAKFMMLGPLILGMAGIMAIKALIASVISLTISKIMIIKKLMKNKGGGGHGGGGGWESSSGGGGGGWSLGGGGGGGGGGWDRRSFYENQRDGKSWDASDLAYRAYTTVENLL